MLRGAHILCTGAFRHNDLAACGSHFDESVGPYIWRITGFANMRDVVCRDTGPTDLLPSA